LRARRLGWRTQPGNDGRTLVLVPDDDAPRPRPRPPGQPPVRPPGQPGGQPPAQPVELTALRAAVGTIKEQLEPANNRAERAENRADGAEKRAEAAEARERQGREAADARADQAEQGREAERTRADALRDRIEGLQVELAKAEAEGDALTIETAELTARARTQGGSGQTPYGKSGSVVQCPLLSRLAVFPNNLQGENIMNRRSAITLASALLCVGIWPFRRCRRAGHSS
jgi:hypothetical protein